MLDTKKIMEGIERNTSRNFGVFLKRYGSGVYEIQESWYFQDKEKALEEAGKVEIPPNHFVEVREAVDGSFSHEKSSIWRSDKVQETGGKGDYGLNPDTTSGGPKEEEKPKEISHEAGDTDKLTPETAPNEGSKNTTGAVAKSKNTTPRATGGMGDNRGGSEGGGQTGKLPLKKEKAPNESIDESSPEAAYGSRVAKIKSVMKKAETAYRDAKAKYKKDMADADDALKKAKAKKKTKEGKVPSSPTDDPEGTLIKKLTEDEESEEDSKKE